MHRRILDVSFVGNVDSGNVLVDRHSCVKCREVVDKWAHVWDVSDLDGLILRELERLC